MGAARGPRAGTGRRWAHRVAAVAVTGLVVAGGPSGGGTTSAAASHRDAPGADCPSAGGASAARVRAGGTGQDRNSVSLAQVAAMDRALARATARLQRRGLLGADGRATAAAPVTVSTYVHVITRQNGTGGVTRKQIDDQLAVMNAGYAGRTSAGAAASPFRFVLAGIDTTRNTNWFNWDPDNDSDDRPAKTALHRGGWRDLNIYVTGLQRGVLGYATFPRTTPLKQDGLVVLNQSLPGGTAAPYNQGDTATHEIGHWLGLFHTFEGGCTAPGDAVADTPYQADGDNVFECVESDDTCPQAGRDPVHNFMSYGDDPCLDRFTAGQVTRMTQTWQAQRVGY